MSTRIFDRKRKSEGATAVGAGSDPAAFDSAGVASVTSASEFLAQFGGTELLGNVGVYDDVATAGNASLVVTVPSGKYWRLLSAVVRITADANAANRIGVCLLRDTGDSTIETLTQGSAVTANQDLVRTFGFGTDDNSVGVLAVASQATLTIGEQVTAGDTMVLNGVTVTYVAALTATNQILLGSSEANTKLNTNAALQARDQSGESGVDAVHTVSDASYTTMAFTAAAFSGDDMVLTANVKGTAGDAISCTETFTDAANVFDAATFGTTTAGADSVDDHGSTDFPTSGAYLAAGEDAVFSVTNGVAGDNFEVYLTYIEFDSDPT